MTQFREHFTSPAVLHQPSVEQQGRQRQAQPPLNTTTRGQKGGTQGKNRGTSEEMGKKEDRGYSTFPNCHGYESEALLPLVLIVEC